MNSRTVATIRTDFAARADVAKLADAPDLGSGFRKEVEVQVLSSAPLYESSAGTLGWTCGPRTVFFSTRQPAAHRSRLFRT